MGGTHKNNPIKHSILFALIFDLFMRGGGVNNFFVKIKMFFIYMYKGTKNR